MAIERSVLLRRGMLARVIVHEWSGSISDRALAAKVAAESGGRPTHHKHAKILPTPAELRPWKQAKAELATLMEVLLQEPPKEFAPWKFLSTRAFDIWKESVERVVISLDQAKKEFERAYPAILADGPNRIGTSFNTKDYPLCSEIGKHFGVEIHYKPIPRAEEVSWEHLSPEEQSRIKTKVEEELSSLGRALGEDMKRRTKKAVTHLVERVGALVAKHRTGAPCRFYDTVIEGVREIVATIPNMNIGDDVELDTVVKRIEAELLGFSSTELKASPEAAEEALRKAEDIQKQMSDWS